MHVYLYIHWHTHVYIMDVQAIEKCVGFNCGCCNADDCDRCNASRFEPIGHLSPC